MAQKTKEQHLVLAFEAESVQISVRRFSVREGISQLFSVRLVGVSSDPNLDLEALVGRPALFQVAGGQIHANYGARRWTGIIEHAEQVHCDAAGLSTYYFHLVPNLWLLTQRRETRIFQNLKIPQILKQLLEEWGVDSINELNAVYREHEFIVQYKETDFDFVSRLMEWAGIGFYFKFQGPEGDGWDDAIHSPKAARKRTVGSLFRRSPEDKAVQEAADARAKRDQKRREQSADKKLSGGWLTVDDDDDDDVDDASGGSNRTLAAVPLKLALSDGIHENQLRGARVAYDANPTEAAQREFISQVRLTHNVKPGRVTVRDFDFRAKLDFGLYGSDAGAGEAPEKFYEHYRYEPGGFKASTEPAGAAPVADDPLAYRHLRKEEGEPLASRVLRGLRQEAKVVTFVTNCMDLGPGMTFAIQGHPHPALGQGTQLLVRRFSLEGYVNEAWTFQGEAVDAKLPYRPALKTPKPRIRGVQSAVVVGASGEEIDVDEFGRIKVQFYWDRDGQYSDESSCRVRVSHGWAGPGFGAQFLPRIGQEVLVAFMEGDPDQPVVVGRVYNKVNAVPYALPEHSTRSTWKSDSTPASDGFSELMFEDKREQELVFLQGELDAQKLVKSYETDRIGANLMHVVGSDRSVAVSKLDAAMVGERYLLRTMAPPSLSHDAKKKAVGGNDNLHLIEQGQPQIADKLQDTAVELLPSRLTFTTGQATLVFDGADIRIKAAGNISVKAAGADCIIEGKKVHLNPGRAPASPPPVDAFKLPAHGLFKGHAADPRAAYKQEADRKEIEPLDLAPPEVPEYVEPPESSIKQCELQATLIHCMHPTALRLAGAKSKTLEVVPSCTVTPLVLDVLEKLKVAAPAGKDWQRFVERAPEGDPRPRVTTLGKPSADGKYVLRGNDVITLKAQVRGACGKHAVWQIRGNWTGPETIHNNEASTQVQGWIANPWWSRFSIDTKKYKKLYSKYNPTESGAKLDAVAKAKNDLGWHKDKAALDKAKEAKAKATTPEELDAAENLYTAAQAIFKETDKLVPKTNDRPWKSPVDFTIKGLSWVGGSRGRRIDIQATACRGRVHKYATIVYPSDPFSLAVSFNLMSLGSNSALAVWGEALKKKLDDSRWSLALESALTIRGSAQWKENPGDHRAFYGYDLELGGSPFLQGRLGVGFRLYELASYFQPMVGLALWVIDSIFGASIKFEAVGRIDGMIRFSRKGPDDLSGTRSGSIGGSLSGKLAVDAWLVDKAVLSAGASAKTVLTLKVVSRTDSSPAEGPQVTVSGQWDPVNTEIYWAVGSARKATSTKLFQAVTIGPKHFNLIPGAKIRRWLGVDDL